MNTKKTDLLTMSYAKWVIDTYKGLDKICIASNGTISLVYSYRTKVYFIDSFDECTFYRNRLTAINAYKELEFSLLNK